MIFVTPYDLHAANDAEIEHGASLDPWQRVGVKFLVNAGRAILALDIGLGKTATAIRAADEVGAKRVLVVTKKSLIYQWQREIERWSTTSEAEQYSTKSVAIPDARFVVTNYEVVVRRLDQLMKENWNVIIIDEATYIRNRKAQRSKALHKLARRSRYLWLLTGTPIHNNPAELWSLLHAINHKKWSSYWRWVKTHCNVAENYFGGVDILGVRDPQRLAVELAPVMLRRTKELLNLPPVSYETIHVPLNGRQQRIYRQMEKHFVAWLDVQEEKYIAAPSVLAQITRLRQIACSPALIDGPDDSAKTDALLDLLEDWAKDHKVLVFTSFVRYVNLLLPCLRRYNPVHITGAVSAEGRDAAVQSFQNDQRHRVLVGTTRAMGEGLNLQAASIVIFLDQDWTPAAIDQAIGRAHRRGQTKPIHVVTLAAANTVDEDIAALLERKRGVIRDVEAVESIIRAAMRRSKNPS